MSNEKYETIEDIVAEMRNEGLTGDSLCLEWVGAKIHHYADRIEKAYNRLSVPTPEQWTEIARQGSEIADLKRENDALKRELEAGAEAAQICGEIGEMIEFEAACKESVTDCNRLGNAAAMREACANIAEYAKTAACHTEDAHLLGYLNQIERWAEAALAKAGGGE